MEILHKCKGKTQKSAQKSPRRVGSAYWEKRLEQMGCTMGAGREGWLDYGHDVCKLDFDGRRTYTPPRYTEELDA